MASFDRVYSKKGVNNKMAGIGDLFPQLAGSSGSFYTAGWFIVLVFFVILIGGAVLAIAMSRKKAKKKFKATIYEFLGETVRKTYDTIIIKKDTEGNPFFWLKKTKLKAMVSRENAIVDSNGRITYDLMRVKDQILPIDIQKKTTKIKGKDGKEIEQDIVKFLAEAHITDLEAAARQIDKDKGDFAFMDKYGNLMAMAMQIMGIAVPFVMMLIVIMKMGPLLEATKILSAQMPGIIEQLANIATALEKVAEAFGGTLPPPG